MCKTMCKTMYKKMVVAVGLCLCMAVSLTLGDTARAAELKVGVLNAQQVLEQSTAGKAAKEKIEARLKELQASIKGGEEELEEMKKEIEKKSSAWSEEAKQEKIRDFQKRRREVQARVEDANFEMKGLQDKELSPILKALDEVVGEYGKKNGYTLILNAKSGGVIYSAEGTDITDKIIVELNAAMAGK